MYERLIIDGGILSAPRCTPGTSWNSMELWSQLSVIYCCWVRSTWKRMSWSTFDWIWEGGASGAANPIRLHQAQLCLNIFSKWQLLKEAVLWIFWNWYHLSSAEEWASQLVRGWQDYFEVGAFTGGCGLGWEGDVGSCVRPWAGRLTASWRKDSVGLYWITCGWTAGWWWSRGIFWFLQSPLKVLTDSDLSPIIENFWCCKVAMNCWFLLMILSKFKWLFGHRTCSLGPRIRYRHVGDSLPSGTQ